MPMEFEMSIDARMEYLKAMQLRYLLADRDGRTLLLDRMVEVTGLDRKTLIRRMHGDLERRPRKRQRGRTYGPDVDDAIRVISESYDYICAERLAPNLPQMAQQLAAHGELALTPQLLDQLTRISTSTVQRILTRIQQDTPKLPRRRPNFTNSLTRDVPVRRIPRSERQPGHFEADLVHHCGPVACGEYIHTLQMIDVATGWSERVATLGRSYRVMEDAFRRILARLPFDVIEIHPDNDSAFFNHHLKRFWNDKMPDLQLSRSRRYHSNDNRLVEQKNSSLVRAYLGHERLDSVAQTLALNRLYEYMWFYYNFFQPVMHLQEKIYITTPEGKSRVIRRFDQARSPLDRLCATDAISHQSKQSLLYLRETINPRRLREQIYCLIDQLFALPGATPGKTEDIFQTLGSYHNLQKGDGIPVTLSFEGMTASR